MRIRIHSPAAYKKRRNQLTSEKLRVKLSNLGKRLVVGDTPLVRQEDETGRNHHARRELGLH